jgi:hypothetical protein
MTTEPDKREYFRIDSRLTIEYRRVDAEEFEGLKSVIQYNPSYGSDKAYDMHFMSDVLSQKKSENRDLYAYLRVLEKKLDRILDLLGQEKDSVVYRSLTGSISISGAGVKFASDEPLELKERLELRLGLPIAPFPRVSTLCEVVRVEGPEEEGAGEWHIAVKFLVMNDYDRDVLINYIFTKEREKLRSEKETG